MAKRKLKKREKRKIKLQSMYGKYDGNRFTEKIGEREFSINKNIREMVEVIKHHKSMNNEPNFFKLKMSKHALYRAREILGVFYSEDALMKIQEILKGATRVGEQLAYDGRLCVLYVKDQIAIYISPDLKDVVTVKRYEEMTYKPVKNMLPELEKKYKGKELKDKLIQLHKESWRRLEEKDKALTKTVLEIESETSKEISRMSYLLNHTQLTAEQQATYKKNIADERRKLKVWSKKLFNVKLEKRHIGKSISSLL